MSKAQTRDANLPTGTVEFMSFHEPALDTGDYEVVVEQTLTIPPKPRESEKTISFLAPTRHFSVQGARFSLTPNEIVDVFPPQGSLGEHSNVLPHIMFQRSTLPWERSPGVGESRTWLALLLFDENQTPTQEVLRLGDVLSGSGFETYQLESGQSADDRVTVIDVAKTDMTSLVPVPADLPFLAHVRKDSDGNEISVVLANRLPQNGSTTTMHLVSMEGRYTEAGLDADAFAGNHIRLVSLKSWRFACLDPEQSFKGLLTGASRDPATLRLPRHPNPEAESYLARGFVPLGHELRQGRKTISWYHGPLACGHVTSELPLPIRTADELVRYNSLDGMFDVSYAAAWELGRLLALQNTGFAVKLFNWKRAHTQQLRKARQQIFHKHLPTAEAHLHDELSMTPDDICRWFDRLRLLEGVPFNYLVPDEAMVPMESIRWFWLDAEWIHCLLDGAFSIGRVSATDQQNDTAIPHRDTPHEAVTGFLLRSDVVSGWPGLQVAGFGQNKEKLAILRMDHLSPNILLCLFSGNLQTIEINQKPESLHFGIDSPDSTHADYYKEIRERPSGTILRTVPIPWITQDARVVNISGLANEIKLGITPAEFALEMIEGVQKVIYQKSGT